jgi:cyclomaltodextrinase
MRMRMNHLRDSYNKFISRYKLFGIEKEFQNLGSINGPAVPDWLPGETIYEIYVRAFSEEGTFEGVRKNINRILDLGIRAVWFMPIYPIGIRDRKGSKGCPYAIRDYFTVNPEYGTEQDFRNLIADLHKNNIRVIIDMVANHVSPDYIYLEKQPDLIQRDSTGYPMRAVKEWRDVVDLDYSNPETRKHMLEVMKFWVREFNVDGYRCDVAGMVPLDFWEIAVKELRKLKPDFYMLAEWDRTELHREVFNSTYDWILYNLWCDISKGKADIKEIIEWLDVKTNSYPQNSFFLRFLENHDKNRSVSIFKGELIYPFMTMLFALDGIPLLYNGQEIGASHYSSLFEKETIQWDLGNKNLWHVFKELIDLRRKKVSMFSNEYEFFEPDTNENVICFVKGEKDRLLVLVNLGKTVVDLSFLKLKKIEIQNVLFNTHSDAITDQLAPYQALIAEM